MDARHCSSKERKTFKVLSHWTELGNTWRRNSRILQRNWKGEKKKVLNERGFHNISFMLNEERIWLSHSCLVWRSIFQLVKGPNILDSLSSLAWQCHKLAKWSGQRRQRGSSGHPCPSDGLAVLPNDGAHTVKITRITLVQGHPIAWWSYFAALFENYLQTSPHANRHKPSLLFTSLAILTFITR